MSANRRFAPNFLLDLFANPLDPGYADAAARRQQYGPRPPWRRRGALGLRVIALITTGFLLTIAYREAVAAEPVRSSAHAGLVDEVKAAQARTDQLQTRSDELRRRVTAAQQAALGGGAEELRRIREQEAATGLAAVTGSGVVVQLADAPVPLDPTTGRPSGVPVSRVLDVDLQAVVNGLWAAGAEAVAINGQRLSSVSTIRTAGSAVLVDFRPVLSPYDVSAIGPDELNERFDASAAAGAMRSLVEQYGLGFSLRAEDELRLPAAANPALRYAVPQPTGGPGTTSPPQSPAATPSSGPSPSSTTRSPSPSAGVR